VIYQVNKKKSSVKRADGLGEAHFRYDVGFSDLAAVSQEPTSSVSCCFTLRVPDNRLDA
jgi:hypothetical protein